MKPLLAALLLLACGCTSRTASYYPSGKPRFVTNANFASLTVKADGSFTMVGGDHAIMQRELAATISARGSAFVGMLTALAALPFVK